MLLWLDAHLRKPEEGFLVLHVSMQGRSFHHGPSFWNGLCRDLCKQLRTRYSAMVLTADPDVSSDGQE